MSQPDAVARAAAEVVNVCGSIAEAARDTGR